MSRATISMEGFVFQSRSKKTTGYEETVDSNGLPFHILILADLGGAGARKEIPLVDRKILEINRDNYDSCFEKLSVQLSLPGSETPMQLTELDQLHPDYLFAKAPLFQEFRALKQSLSSRSSYHQIKQSLTEQELKLPPDFFDQLVEASSHTSQDITNDLHDPQTLIRNIVAPHINRIDNPASPELIAEVDQSCADAMRTLIHKGPFRRLEANWRALDMLCRRIQTNSLLKLFILDISEQELREQFAQSDDITTTDIYRRLIADQAGDIPFSVLVSDIVLSDQIEDIRLAAGLSALAIYSGGIALASGHERIAGCKSLNRTPAPEDWDHTPNDQFYQMWQRLRAEPQAQSLLITCPRFLLRLPYGEKTSPTEAFAFEELNKHSDGQYYLWGQGAYLATLLIANTYEQRGWNFSAGTAIEVADLPLHIRYAPDGECEAQATAEIYMTDATASALMDAGLCPLRSVKNDAAILIPQLNSVAEKAPSVLAGITA